MIPEIGGLPHDSAYDFHTSGPTWCNDPPKSGSGGDPLTALKSFDFG